MKNFEDWGKEYKRRMEKIKFSDDEKEEILKNLLTEKNGYEKKHRRTLKPAAAAAVVVGVIGAGTIGVCAATGVIPVADAFKNVYDFSGDSREKAEIIGNSIGKEVVSGGIKITADALIGDQRHCAVIYSIEKEDGTAFDTDEIKESDGNICLGFEKSHEIIEPRMEANNLGWAMSGNSYFVDNDKNDNKIQYVQIFEVDKNIIGGCLHSNFKDIRLYDEEWNDTDKLLANGEWNFDIPLDYEDSERLYRVDTEIKYCHDPVYVESLIISNIGFELNLRSYEVVPASLIMKDGREINLIENGYTEGDDDKSMIYKYTSMFERIYDHNDFKALRIADSVIDISDMSVYQGNKEELEKDLTARRSEIFSEPNRGIFYFDISYEGDDTFEGIGTTLYKGTEQIGNDFMGSSDGDKIKKGETVSCMVMRGSVTEQDENDMAKVIKRYSLDEIGFKINLWKNNDEYVAVDIGNVAKEFGKVYKIRITGNEKNGFRAEYMGEGELKDKY